MPQTAPQQLPAPTTEALAFSASLFTSSIASWIPPNFGVTKSETDKQADFELALKEEKGGRLGLGHPLIDAPRKYGDSRGGNGLAGLSKKLGNDKKNKDKEGGQSLPQQQPEDVDEEESRVKSVGKGKKSVNGVLDMFGGKKKRKAEQQVHPLAQQQEQQTAQTPLSKASTPSQDDKEQKQPPLSNPQSPVIPPEPSTPPPASSPGGSGIFPFQGPLALESPIAKKMMEERITRKRRAEEVDQEEEEGSGRKERSQSLLESQTNTPSKKQDQGPKSKTQIRREARKRAKLSQLQSAE